MPAGDAASIDGLTRPPASPSLPADISLDLGRRWVLMERLNVALDPTLILYLRFRSPVIPGMRGLMHLVALSPSNRFIGI